MKADGTNASSGSFSVNVGSLEAGKTYYYKAYIREWNAQTQEWEYRYATNVESFTTSDQTSDIPSGWLELPETSSSTGSLLSRTHWVTMGGKTQRNYSFLYDPASYTSMWVAYPLCSDHMGTGTGSGWKKDPDVSENLQTDVRGGYGVSIATPNYPNNSYGRGHQIPNADRNGVNAMNSQTYYSTNCTPQIQDGFNGGIWKNLEEKIRTLVPSGDTLYIITGAAFVDHKDGGSESKVYITNSNDGKSIPVPNYYWKAILKVKRNGDSISSACAIGFWFHHEEMKGQQYASYAISVSELQERCGFNLFANLPGDNSSGIEKAAESNTNWTIFQNF